MKTTSNFYLVSKVINKFANHTENYLIDLIFPEIKDKYQLVSNLSYFVDQIGYYEGGLVLFYENLDETHKILFDEWFDLEIEKLR